MFSDPTTITFSALDSTFDRFALGAGRSDYVDDTSTDATRQTLRIIQATGARDKKDPNFVQKRHVIQLARDEYVSAAARHELALITLTISHPNTDTITRAELNRLVGLMSVFSTTTGVMDKIYRGEL